MDKKITKDTLYQKDTWFEPCMYSGRMIYNFRGDIGIKENNDPLRTYLIARVGEPYLAILPEVDYKVPFLDFSKKENPTVFGIEWMKKDEQNYQ